MQVSACTCLLICVHALGVYAKQIDIGAKLNLLEAKHFGYIRLDISTYAFVDVYGVSPILGCK